MKIKPTAKKGQAVITLEKKDEKLLAEIPASGDLDLKRILVPIDFSERSQKSLRYAMAFATQFKATLCLIHIVQINYIGGEFGAVEYPLPTDELIDNSKKKLEEWGQKLIGTKVPYQTIVKTGHIMAEIVATAKELEVDLIVVSTHGFTGFKHVLLGSNAESVIRHAPCPVLTVREMEKDFVKEK